MEVFHYAFHEHEEDFLTGVAKKNLHKDLQNKIKQGEVPMRRLDFNYGFNVVLLEDALLPDPPFKWMRHNDCCCFCPLMTIMAKNNNYSMYKNVSESNGTKFSRNNFFGVQMLDEKELGSEWYECKRRDVFTRDELLKYLATKAYKDWCHYHLVALQYLTHMCFLKARKVHKVIMKEFEDLDNTYQEERIEKVVNKQKERKKLLRQRYVAEQKEADDELVTEEDGGMTPENGVDMMKVDDNEE